MDFLSNLQKLLIERNISQNKLAKDIGISSSTITLWKKRGHDHVNINTLFKISEYFDVSVEELVHGQSKIYKSITFTEKEFTLEELNIILDFSKFLISNRKRIDMEDLGEIKPLDFSILDKLENNIG